MTKTLCLKLSESFTKVIWTIGFALSAGSASRCLNLVIEGIALGTAYIIWTGKSLNGGYADFAPYCFQLSLEVVPEQHGRFLIKWA